MADHLWIIPVSAGVENQDMFNVQWHTAAWPTTASPATVTGVSKVGFTPKSGVAEAVLGGCNGFWEWTSIQLGGNVSVGSQFLLGTVFAAKLLDNAQSNPITWNTVDVWIKFKVSDKTRFDSIKVVINDDGGVNRSSSAELITVAMTNGEWFIGSHTVSSLSSWDTTNLRVLLVALGTSNSSNVGDTSIEVEWITIRLRNV
jgi:hypothetical protein